MSDSKELLDEANGKIALRADGWLSPEEVAALRSEVATLRERLRVIATAGTGAALTEAWRLLEDANDEAEEDAETIRKLCEQVAELKERAGWVGDLSSALQKTARESAALLALADAAAEAASLAGTESPIEIAQQLRGGVVHNEATHSRMGSLIDGYAAALAALYAANDEWQRALLVACGEVEE